MPLVLWPLLYRRRPHQLYLRRSFIDAKIKWVRDRDLDHVVEMEKNLKPMVALKNLLKSSPTKSLPISIVAESKDKLNLPTRAIKFIHQYPSIFRAFLPRGSIIRPHVRLTPEILCLDKEERLIYQSQKYQQEAANRLMKLLMLTRIGKVPFHIIDRLKWDMGLPHDFILTLIPNYPDYFQISSVGDGSSGTEEFALELVCWYSELAVSVMEQKCMSGEVNYKKGAPLAFPLQFSKGFDLEKKVKKWVDDWQKLPYISPYEDASHLLPHSDQAEKWTVAVLHELLSLLVSKKTERDNILLLGEYLGFGSRFKKALMHHPGIFYLSNKIRTQTVVLRESYKRDLLVEKHPLMGMRYRYIHLMNKVKKGVFKLASRSLASPRKQRITSSSEGRVEEVK